MHVNQESISALMDDEATDEETLHALTFLKRDDEAQKQWRNFHIIKTVLQGLENRKLSKSLDRFESPIVIHSTSQEINNPHITPLCIKRT